MHYQKHLHWMFLAKARGSPVLPFISTRSSGQTVNKEQMARAIALLEKKTSYDPKHLKWSPVSLCQVSTVLTAMKTAPAWYSKGAGVNTASPGSSTKDWHNSTNRSSSEISLPVVKQCSSQIHSRKKAGQMLLPDGKNASSFTSESATHAYCFPLNGLLSLVEWPSFYCAHHEDTKAGIAEIWRDLTTNLARVNTLMKTSWPCASYSQVSDLLKLQIQSLHFHYSFSKCYLSTLKEHSLLPTKCILGD